MFGLMSSEQFKTERSLNSRRRVFYEYPNGAMPLTGLLSLMDTEETDKPEFGWYEDRMQDQKATLGTISAGFGPFSAQGSDVPSTAAGFNIAANDVIRVRTEANGTSKFRTTNVIWIRKVRNAAGKKVSIKGVITAIVGTNKFEMRVLSAQTGVLNNDTPAPTGTLGLKAWVIGTANPEGASSTKGFWTPPRNITNYTQIFRTAFSFTRTALKIGVKFDKSGIYRQKAKQNGLRHMCELEKAFLFGEKQEYVTTDADGEEVPERNMGGILWFLEQWEQGLYDNEVPTNNAHPNKRIIDCEGSCTPKEWDDYVSRAFKVTNNKDYSKLVLCGNGFLNAIARHYDSRLTLMSSANGEDTYKMSLKSVETLSGTLYFKTHPLFNLNDDLSYSAIFIDVPNLEFRPLTDSDTVLLKNRQGNDQDRRKDEWITECGLELRLPESFMFIDDLQEIS